MRFFGAAIFRTLNAGRTAGLVRPSPPLEADVEATSTSGADTTRTPDAGPNRLAKSIVIENWLFASR